MDSYILEVINNLCSVGILSISTVVTCFGVIALLYRFYGIIGLFVYQVLAIILSNIQVLKTTTLWGELMPLGTVVFSTTFLVGDLLVEKYGVAIGKKTIGIGLIGQCFFMISMLLCVAHPSSTTGVIDGSPNLNDALSHVFTPSLRFFISSQIAFGFSQLADVIIFQRIKVATKGRYLWIRQQVSMFVSGILDNTIFSWVAFTLLGSAPFGDIWMGTTLYATCIRFLVSLASTPMLYYLKKMVPVSRENFLLKGDHV